jgi:hypothetical protein
LTKAPEKIRRSKAEVRKKLEGRKPKIASPGRGNEGALGLTCRFGFRISDFFRASVFGFRPWLSTGGIAFLFCALTPFLLWSADTNAPTDPALSSLKPPRDEILPTFWEQYGVWLVLAAAVALVGMGFLVWRLTRPRPIAPEPWSLRARRELEPLSHHPENGALLSRISQILRHYLCEAFTLPAGEMTTSEFCRTVLDSEKFGPELAREIDEFLRELDRRKFAPQAPENTLDAAARAAKIIDRAEARVAEVERVTTGPRADARLTDAPKAVSRG